MFWRMQRHSMPCSVDSVLEKESFTIEELLDENEIIEECRSLNKRLINFLRGKAQVQQMVQYIVEEPPEGTDNQQLLKFPFICSEIFTCEIDVILKTLVENEELMDLLFSFLNNKQRHETLFVGYFCKVVACLISRRIVAVMRYLQEHQEILRKLVDMIGFASITELLVRLVGGDEHAYNFHADAFQWLADTQLLELLVDKLSPHNSLEVHTNAADALSFIARMVNSALAIKLNTPSFVGRLFDLMLEEPRSRSALIHSLSICISLLDPKRAARVFLPSTASEGGNCFTEPSLSANLDTVGIMLQRLGDLLCLLDNSAAEEVLLTTYGALKPPLGSQRLKIVEFLSILLRSNSEVVKREFVRLGIIQAVLKLFFEYPFHNGLHHCVDALIGYCIESNSKVLIPHILHDCNLIGRLLAADEDPFLSCVQTQTTAATPSRTNVRVGNLGHLTRIANRIVQASINNSDLQVYLQEHPKWAIWQSNVLQNRNMIENVYQWTCGRPASLQNQFANNTEFFQERDYDTPSMLSDIRGEAFQDSKAEEDDQIGDNNTLFSEGDYDMPTMSSEIGNEASQEGANNVDESRMVIDDEYKDIDLGTESSNVLISPVGFSSDQDSSDGLNGIASSNQFLSLDDSANDSVQAFLPSSSCNASSHSSSNGDATLGAATRDNEDESLETVIPSKGFNLVFGNGLEKERPAGLQNETGMNSVDVLSLELEKAEFPNSF